MSVDPFVRFIQMGGYGGYVWSAYGVALFALLFHFFYARKQFQKARQAVIVGGNPVHAKGARTVVVKELS